MKNYFYFNQDKEQRVLIATAPRNDTFVFSPPRYESIIKADDMTNFNKLSQNSYLDLGRKSPYRTVSDSEGVQSNGVSIFPVFRVQRFVF